MARVVQRRSNPPYLLIIFVFLFLISATFAVMTYVNLDKTRKELEGKTVEYTKLAGETDQAVVKQLVDLGTKSRPNRTVVGQLRKQVEDLAGRIVEKGPSTYENAAIVLGLSAPGATTQPEDLDIYHQIGWPEHSSLEKLIKDLNDKINKNQAALATLKTDLGEKQAKIEELNEKAKKDRENYNKALGDKDTKALDIQKKFDEVKDAADKQIAELRAEIEKAQVEYNKTLAEKTADIEKLKAEAVKLAKDNGDLKRKMSDLKNPPVVTMQPDGKVVTVVDSARICYISLGEQKKVTAGLTFAVYPSTGITEKAPKARIMVKNVDKSTSECTILEEDNRDPITQGDLICNVAYSTGRSYTFVVEGDFDIRGTGQATSAGTDAVKAMIAKASGKIVDTVSSDVDYVVMGEAPARVAEPKEGVTLTPSEEKLMKDQKKAYDHYQLMLQQANSLRIPVLNTNRFLDLVGYSNSTTK